MLACGCVSLIAIATVALLLPGTAALAQAPPLETDDPSPATRHAQVIAHGVAPMPADEVAWRVAVDRAVPPTRADAEERPAGFILADKGVVALVDQDGQRVWRGSRPAKRSGLSRVSTRAVIGLERKAPDYYDIALVPATELAEGGSVVIGGAPFVAPTGDAFDVDLIRDVLNRAEEGVVSTGPSPALLLVTSGTVFVESTSSGLVEMTTGEAAQVAGDVVITGASRAPAAFVVARIGPEVPAPAAAEDLHVNRDPGFHRHPGQHRGGRVRHDLGVTLPDRVCGRERRRGLRRCRERRRVQPDVRRCRNRYRPSKRRR